MKCGWPVAEQGDSWVLSDVLLHTMLLHTMLWLQLLSAGSGQVQHGAHPLRSAAACTSCCSASMPAAADGNAAPLLPASAPAAPASSAASHCCRFLPV